MPIVNSSLTSDANPSDQDALYPYVSVMACIKGNPDALLAERDLEMAFAGVKILGNCGLRFAANAGGSNTYYKQNPSWRRMSTKAFPCANGTVIPIGEVATGLKYSIQTYKADGTPSVNSGWLTSPDDYTISDANAALFTMGFANEAGNQITPSEAYAITRIPGFNVKA